MWTRVNPEFMFFKNGKRYAKSKTMIQKALEERIPNHILHVQFERKTSVSQSNLLYPQYVYNYPKRQKMPKRVKMFTSKWHRKQRHFFILDHSNAFGLSGGNFLSRTSLPEPILSGEGGGVNFQLFPLFGPLAFWLDQTGTCTTWLWGLQYKTIIVSLWYLATEELR